MHRTQHVPHARRHRFGRDWALHRVPHSPVQSAKHNVYQQQLQVSSLHYIEDFNIIYGPVAYIYSRRLEFSKFPFPFLFFLQKRKQKNKNKKKGMGFSSHRVQEQACQCPALQQNSMDHKSNKKKKEKNIKKLEQEITENVMVRMSKVTYRVSFNK